MRRRLSQRKDLIRRRASAAKMRERNRAAIRAYDAAWREKNRQERREYHSRWQKENRDKCNAAKRRHRKKLKLETEETFAELPCFDCGMKHDEETRLRIIRRMLPSSVWEIRESWPCFWGPPDEEGSGRARQIYRDLAKMGAVRDGGIYKLREGRAA